MSHPHAEVKGDSTPNLHISGTYSHLYNSVNTQILFSEIMWTFPQPNKAGEKSDI